MRLVGIAAVLGLVGGITRHARADDAPAKVEVGGSLAVWFPTSDADDFADVSLAVRPVFIYWLRPFIGITGQFDFVLVNEDGTDDVTYFALSAGARLTLPREARIRPYGELVLGWHHLDATGFDDDNLGFRLGGGATYALGGSLTLSGGVAYSTTSFDAGFVDVTIAAFVFDVGVAARF